MVRSSTFHSISLHVVRGTRKAIVSLNSLIRSCRIVGLRGESRTLIGACPFKVFIASGCVLLGPSTVSPVGLFAHGNRCITSVNNVKRNPKRCGAVRFYVVSRGRGHVCLNPKETGGVLACSLGKGCLSSRTVRFGRVMRGPYV